jgi:protein-disulfide isomerase
LVSFGKQAGITSPDFATCVTTTKYSKWATNGVEREAQNRGVNTTPTVFINGKELDRTQYTPAGITAAVAAASK